MPFDTLSDRLKLVVQGSLALCKSQWGHKGLKKEEAIHPNISWVPTFYVKPSPALIIALEVQDTIFPSILKIAAHDIDHYDFPISVYQACPLDIFQKDTKLTQVKLLRDHGFGLITVDEAGGAFIQMNAAPLAQHISPEKLEAELKPLTQSLKVKFKTAHATYQTNVGQGLQEAGQIIEALVLCIARQAEAAKVVSAGTTSLLAAPMIDELYAAKLFHPSRAALGGARSFVKAYRNIASHPANTAADAIKKIHKCKTGFFDAVRIAGDLQAVIENVGYKVRIV